MVRHGDDGHVASLVVHGPRQPSSVSRSERSESTKSWLDDGLASHVEFDAVFQLLRHNLETLRDEDCIRANLESSLIPTAVIYQLVDH